MIWVSYSCQSVTSEWVCRGIDQEKWIGSVDLTNRVSRSYQCSLTDQIQSTEPLQSFLRPSYNESRYLQYSVSTCEGSSRLCHMRAAWQSMRLCHLLMRGERRTRLHSSREAELTQICLHSLANVGMIVHSRHQAPACDKCWLICRQMLSHYLYSFFLNPQCR